MVTTLSRQSQCSMVADRIGVFLRRGELVTSQMTGICKWDTNPDSSWLAHTMQYRFGYSKSKYLWGYSIATACMVFHVTAASEYAHGCSCHSTWLHVAPQEHPPSAVKCTLPCRNHGNTALDKTNIEGLHDAARTYVCTIFQSLLVLFTQRCI